MDGIAKAIGLKPEEATPEQIAAERDAERATRRGRNGQPPARHGVELAVFRAAAARKADREQAARLPRVRRHPRRPGPGGRRVRPAGRRQDRGRAGGQPGVEGLPAAAPAAAVRARQQPGRRRPYAPGVAGAALPGAAAAARAADPGVRAAGLVHAAPPGPRQLTEADAAAMSPAQVAGGHQQGPVPGSRVRPVPRAGAASTYRIPR